MDPTRRRLLARLAVVAAAAATSFPSEAKAQEVAGGGGVYVSLVLGDKVGVGWGAEAFATALMQGSAWGCGSEPRAGVGPLVQFGLVNLGAPRVVAGVHAGGELIRAGGVSLDTELGATLRFGERGGAGLHTGIAVGSPFLAYGFVREEWLLEEYAFGAGARGPSLFGQPGTCVEGRPLRTDEGLAQRARARRGAELAPPRASDAPELLGRAWENDAESECASVPAFLQLAGELLHAGAPASLIDAAITAAEQEIAHAALCAQLASAYAGRRVTPSLPDVGARAPLAGVDALERLAVESWVDGCVGEGAAAARAARAAELADEPLARAVHTRIALEEREHAELAWRVMAWAITRGGAPVRDALRAARHASPAPEPDDGPLPADWTARGRLAAADRNAILRAHAVTSRARLDAISG